MSHACHANEKVPDVLCLPHKTMFQTSKCPWCPTPATRNEHGSKTEHGALVKRQLSTWPPSRLQSVRACAVETHMDISEGNFITREFTGKKAGPDPPKMRDLHFARACSRKQDGHSTRATSCENLEEKSRRQDHAPWPHQAFATTVKTPQCGHTVRGKKHWIPLQYWAPCLIPCGFPSLKGTHWVVGLYNIIAVRPKKQFDFVAVLGSMFSSLWVSQPHGEILGSRLITLHLYPEKSVWSSCSP